MTEPSDPVDTGAPDTPPSVDDPTDGLYTAAWCGRCRELYDPGPHEVHCPKCGAAATAWDTGALYRALAPGLVRYVRSLLRAWNVSDARVDAEGAVNDAFLAMIRKTRASDTTIDNPAAWLFVVARRHAARTVRRHRWIAEHDREGHAVDHRSVQRSTAARRASANDIRGARIVLRAIAELPDRQKVATYLQTIQGWTLQEIAEYLECSASTAGVHVHRGKVRVLDRLEEDWESGDWALMSARPRVSGHREGGHNLPANWSARGPARFWFRPSDRALWVVASLVGVLAAAVCLSDRRGAFGFVLGSAIAGSVVVGGLAVAGVAEWLCRRRNRRAHRRRRY